MFALRSGARLGNYELLRVVGSGGMGVVYEARHETLDRRVAIKLLHARAPDTAKADLMKARFLREGRAAGQVRHAHVVDVIDFGVQDGTPFLVMELVEGETLADKLAREGVMSVAASLELILPVLSAVAELHAAGIIHRDLKPGNILLGRGRGGEICPKVADFGVSRADDDSAGLTESGVVVGTYAYMPPEQARATKTVTEQADQYALATILYECLTGTTPFKGESSYDLTHAILHAPLVPPSARNGALAGAVDSVLLRAMSREPGSRFACIEDLGAALLTFASPEVAARWFDELGPPRDDSAALPPAASAPAPSARPTRRLRASAAALAFVCAGGILAAAMLGRREPSSVVPTETNPSPTGTAAAQAPFRALPPEPARLEPSPPATPQPVDLRTPPSSVLPRARRKVESGSASPASSPPPPKQPDAVDPALDNGAPILDPE